MLETPLTREEALNVKSQLLDSKTIWWDWDNFEWVGVAADGTQLGLSSNDDTFLDYLASYPGPEHW